MALDVSRTVRDCLTIVLAGGQGSRLHELTYDECKPAIYFGGSGRIVDYALANALRSGTSDILVATQYKPDTLVQHLRADWAARFVGAGGRMQIRDARFVTGRSDGYRGTADAVTRNIGAIDAIAPKDVLILAADHVYRMDYGPMIDAHRKSGAAATVAVHPVPLKEASAFGVVDAGLKGRIRGFAEKPSDPRPMAREADLALVSMGIYVFRWEWLRERLKADLRSDASTHDFGHDILPLAVREGVAQAWTFAAETGAPYWRDVGTLDAFREAQIDFARPRPPIDLGGELHRIEGLAETAAAFSPERAARCLPLGSMVDRSLVSEGCRVGYGARIASSVLMPRSMVGENARLSRVIVAPGTLVPRGFVVGEDPVEDARWFRRTAGGTVLMTQAMLDRRRDSRARVSTLIAGEWQQRARQRA